MIFVNHRPKKLVFTWAFNHTSEDGLLSFHKKYGIMELWSCRVDCNLPLFKDGWCSSQWMQWLVLAWFGLSRMYCRVPHNCCMWCHTSFQLSSSLYTVHTLQYILQKSGLLWKRIFDPLWGLTGNIDVTWLLTGLDPKLFQFRSWHHNPLNNRMLLLQVSGVTFFCSYNKHASTNCSANCFSLYLFSVFHSIILCSCCLFGGKTEWQCQEHWARNNCRPESWSISIAVTAMKPQLTSADKCDCVCTCVESLLE